MFSYPPFRSNEEGFSVRRPVMLPLLITLFCLLTAFVVATQWLGHALENDALQNEVQEISQELQQEMDRQALVFKHQMVLLTQSDTLRQHFRAGDRKALLHASKPILNTLSENRVTHFYFHHPDRVVFLRVHKPDFHGDTVDRQILLRAERSNTFAYGAEIGRFGALTLRAVLPWWDGPTLIGFLELGKEIEHFVEEWQSTFERKFYVFLHKEYLDTRQWREVSQKFGVTLDWKSFADLVFIGPKETHYPDGLRHYVESKLWQNDTPLLTISPELGQEHGRFFAVPIRDDKNRVVCQIIGMTSFAQQQSRIHRYKVLIVGSAIGLILLLLLFFHRLLRQVEQKVQITADALRQSETSLVESRAELQNILESLEDGILMLGGSNTIRYVNARFFALWNIPKERIQIQNFDPLLTHLQGRLTKPTHFLAQLEDLSSSLAIASGTLNCQDGQTFEYHSFPIPCVEMPCDRVWVFRDTTQRATMERREEQAQQSRIAISALLETGIAPLSLENQLHAALDIILAVPWLALEYQGAIFLMEEDGEYLVMATQRGLASHLLTHCAQVPMGHCLCGRAAQRREIVFAAHIDADHETHYAGIRPHGHYCIPILTGTRLIGVLNLYVPDGHVSNTEEIAFLTTISYTLANLIERRSIEQNLLDAHEFSAALLSTAPALVVVLDPEGRVILFNQACQRLTGYTESEILGQTIKELVPPEELRDLQPVWQQLIQTQAPNQHENHWQAKNGDRFLIAWSNNVIRNSDGSLRSVIATGIDITEKRRTEEILRHVAGHDALTGLPNRALFQVRLSEHLSMASRSGNEIVLMFLDLDKFKQINDTLGHNAGDALLVEATQRILSCVRDYDLVARLGGDEFTIILPQLTHVYYVEFIARRILEELAKPFLLEAGEANISGSIGITLFPQDAEDLESLLKNADTAMYSAKKAGRNAFCFYTGEMQSAAMERLEMEKQLRTALHNQEFILHYQPKLDMTSQQIIGMEALLRWQRPDGEQSTLVPPNAFIPLAEETGLIVPLGAWVLQTACHQNKVWQTQGLPPLRVAVNISANQFNNPEALIEAVTRALQETQLDPEFLELEITGLPLKPGQLVEANS